MSTEPATLEVVEDKEITTLIESTGIAKDAALSIQESFKPFFVEARAILEKSRAINVTDVSQTLEMKVARAYRLGLRKIRTTSDATRKKLNEDANRRTKAINGFHAILEHLIETEETRLDEAEKFALKKEEERRAKLKGDREEAMKPYGLDTSFIDLGAMDDVTFQTLLENSRAAHEKRQEDARRAEQQRIEAENARLKEEVRIREENARLKREADEREAAAKAERERLEAIADEERKKAKIAAALAEAERIRVENEAKAEKARVEAENEAKLAAERAKAAEELRLAQEKAALERKQAQDEADRVAREKQAIANAEAQKAKDAAKRAKAAADKKLAEERAAKEAAEAENQRIKDQLAREEGEKREREKQESIRALQASLAPDREKLTAYVAAVRALVVPPLSSEAGKAIEANLVQRREAYCAYLERTAATL